MLYVNVKSSKYDAFNASEMFSDWLQKTLWSVFFLCQMSNTFPKMNVAVLRISTFRVAVDTLIVFVYDADHQTICKSLGYFMQGKSLVWSTTFIDPLIGDVDQKLPRNKWDNPSCVLQWLML